MAQCERCDSSYVVDFCDKCYSELCSECMAKGCCDITPAESGSQRQEKERQDYDDDMSKYAGMSHWEEFEIDYISEKGRQTLAKMGIESATSCRWHEPQELKDAGISRRDMSEIERYHGGPWKKWDRPEGA